MNYSNLNRLLPLPAPAIALLVCAVLVVGCRREDVQVYEVEKEKPAAAEPANPHGPSPHGPMTAAAKPGWKLPDGWTERPSSGMRVASFIITGPDGQAADVGVIPLRGVTGRDLDMVNMWRNQAGLAAVSLEEMSGLTTKVPVGPVEGKLFNFVSAEPPEGQKHPLRVMAALLDREGTGWFFKMTGSDPLVTAQRTAFLDFLKSIEFPAADAAAAAPADSPHGGMMMGAPPLAAGSVTASASKPTWTVPPTWQEVPGGQFLVAKFNLAGEGGVQAAVNVSTSAGEGGGWADNVNRWRRQLGLDAISAEEVAKATTSLDAGGGQAKVVNLAGTDARTGQAAACVGVMVPQGGQSWFYKLMGDAKVVESQKDAFKQFVQSVKY